MAKTPINSMKEKKILILGYFGYQNNQLDGQTIKTRNILTLLKSKMNDARKIRYFDTQDFQVNITSFFSMLWKIMNSKMIIYLPAHNNLKYIFPILFLICKLLRIKILYIVVGGWLYEYLENKPLHRLFLKKIYGILAENMELIKKIRIDYKFDNIGYFPNFRIHNYKPDFKKDNGPFKIVFMARVMKIKGIDTLFKLCDHLERKYNKDRVTIHIYGPIPEEERSYFFDNLKNHAIIEYKGVLEPKNIYTTLSKYDILIFPTRYLGEGFPGTILDAYISGLPVIASNWRYIPEFIDEDKTGYLFDVNHIEELFQYVEYFIENPQILKVFRENALKKSEEKYVMGANMTLQKFEDFKIRSVVTPKQLTKMQNTVKKIYLDDSIKEYILEIVRKTREKDFASAEYISYGSSPRASIGLFIASKAKALMNARNYVIPEDVRDVVYSVLRHRLILSYKATIQKISPDSIIDEILSTIRVF